MAIISISGGVHSGRKALAESLGRKLGYRVLSQEELISDAAKEFGVSQERLESALLHKPPTLEDRGIESLHRVHCVQAALAKAVRSDNVVYHGHAGHLLAGVPHHLRIKATANLEYRVDAAMERSEVSREDAIQDINHADEEREDWANWIYGDEVDQPLTYDVAINLARVSTASACIILAETATSRYQMTTESHKIADDVALASEIRARIGLDRGVCDDRIDVEADHGVVTITGSVRSLDDVNRVGQLTRRVPGVKCVLSKLEAW